VTASVDLVDLAAGRVTLNRVAHTSMDCAIRFRHPGNKNLALESRRYSLWTICYFAMLNTINKLRDTYRIENGYVNRAMF
jgi:hypothetical protein